MSREFSYLQQNKKTFLDLVGQLLSSNNIRKKVNQIKKSGTHNPSTLLDFGCGFHAYLSQPIWKRFDSVFLMDFNLNAELEGFANKVKLFTGNPLQDIKLLQNETIDFLLANNVLEHVTQEEELLLEFNRVLASNGLLYINVPSWLGKYFLELAAFKLKMAPREEMEDHKRYYSKRELWLALRRAGMQPSKIRIKNTKFGLNICAVVVK